MTAKAAKRRQLAPPRSSEGIIHRLWPVLYEDDDLIAIVKPWGIDSGRLESAHRPGAAEILLSLFKCDADLVPANRLSRYESGVLLLGKNRAIVEHIRNGLRAQRIQQEFVAVVHGRMTTKFVTVGGAPRASREGQRSKAPRRKGATGKSDPASDGTTITALQHGKNRTLVSIRTVAPTTHALKAQLRAVRLRSLGDVTRNQTKRPMTHQMTCMHWARLSFHHPGQGRRVQFSCPPPDGYRAIVDGARDLTRPLFAGLARRALVLADREIDACRLLIGPAEDVPGLIVDKFGDVVFLELLDARGDRNADLKALATWYRQAVGAKTVLARTNTKSSKIRTDTVPRDEPDESVRHIAGTPCPESLIIRERALKFIVRPDQAGSVGLYADHRDNRERIRAMAGSKDVLNLFAYTCGFSLAAAVGGAASTVSVDLSGRHLEWGRENFALNHIATEQHEFIQSDSFEYLRRARRQERSFDLIVVDPPSFAHGRRRGQDFSVARDMTPLVADCLEVLRPGGVMMVSTNLRRMSTAGLRERVRAASNRRRCRVIETPPLPDDFAVDPDHAKTVFFELA